MHASCTITLAVRSFPCLVNTQFDPVPLFYHFLNKRIIDGVDLVFPVIALNVLDRGDRNRVGANSHFFYDPGGRLQTRGLLAKIVDVDGFGDDCDL